MLSRRKCLRVRVLGLLVLVCTFLALLEHWRGEKRLATADPAMTVDDEYERQVLEDEARIIPWLGQGGVPVHLSGMDADLGKISLKNNAINVYLSDRIPFNRSLGDFRHPSCNDVLYDAELPSVSVILIFHNEPFSVVVRTIWSVLNTCKRSRDWYSMANYIDKDGNVMKLGYPGQDPNSKYIYLKEIILVDDNSTLPELKGKLSHYIRTRLPPDLITILRLPDRRGVARARSAGARAATADTMVFLDCQCEATLDWLRPLLQRMKDNRTSVVTPVIDVIESLTLELAHSVEISSVGGFNFNGDFTWIPISKYENDRRGSEIAPLWSPTMAGGLFAVDRSYFWELGGYDEQMTGWGGENIEMSFRVWMCGGTLEIIPCSRVGHIFRAFHPYGLPASSDTFGVNTARMAEVWMDQYKELFYLYRADLRNNPVIGDVTHRKILREKLKCKDFQWYLDNIYRDKYVPIRDVYSWGRIMNPKNYICVDNYSRSPSSSSAAASVYPCHPDLKPSQFWSLTRDSRIRSETACLDIEHMRDGSGTILVMKFCEPTAHKGQQFQSIIDDRIQHIESGLCIDARHSGDNIRLVTCDPESLTQKWKFDFTEDSPLYGQLFQNMNQVKMLESIRGKRSVAKRISRSLLEDNKEEDWSDDGRRKLVKKTTPKRFSKLRITNNTNTAPKKKVKDKFILTLVRTLGNKTEHLEVTIQCKHTKLKPNNQFVRDIVSVLNSKDIAVVNNGRVFRHNKATELSGMNPLTLKRMAPRKKVMRNKPQTTEPPEIVEEAPTTNKPRQYYAHKNIVVEEFGRSFTTLVPSFTERNKHSSSRVHSALRQGGYRPKKTQSRQHKSKKIAVESVVPQSLEDSPMWERDLNAHFRASETDRDDVANWRRAEKDRDTDDEKKQEVAEYVQENKHKEFYDAKNREDSSNYVRVRSNESHRKYEGTYEQTVSTTRPVEVLLRSNLTFVLGEDFFNWRKSNDEQGSPPADSLAIPGPSEPPSRARTGTGTGTGTENKFLSHDQTPRDSDKDNSLTSSEDYAMHLL